MTAQPAYEPAPQPTLLTVAQYLALGETEQGYDELVEGRVVMSPSPKPRHNRGGYRVGRQLEPQLPEGLEVLLDVDVDLGLAAPDGPGFVRRPDFIVIGQAAADRADDEDDIIRASEVEIVGEILSPGSVRTDQVVKRGEYADAGIPHYWIVDLGVPVSLLACHLAGEFGYQDAGPVTGTFTTASPFPLTLDLEALR